MMDQKATAVLLANLGSPDSDRVDDVKNYLREFLMDERVIDLPYLVRTVLVKWIIVPFRAPGSAAKYKTVWTENGSPLIHISRRVQSKLREETGLTVELCMRYANPAPQSALKKLTQSNPGLKELIVVPLYPHYAMSSYETAVEQIRKIHREGGYSFQMKIVPPFYGDPGYIQSLVLRVRPFLRDEFDHILFSYHGIPERHVKKTDTTKSHCLVKENCCDVPSIAHGTCYRHQVMTTTQLVAKALSLPEDKFSVSFQSRLGADAWLRPATVEQLASFPKRGIKKLAILCPAFVSDCLETLEEIEMEGRAVFMKSGGEQFTLIPCLNDSDEWIGALAGLVRKQITAPEAIVN